jgi:ketosteroid isomerase-like protein
VTPGSVEIVRRAAEAYQRRDMEAVLESLSADVELYPVRAVLEGEPYHGHEGFRRFLDDMKQDWEEFHTHLEEVRDLGDDRVLVIGRFSARGMSGVQLDSPAVWKCEVREGKIARLRFYTDEEAALSDR